MVASTAGVANGSVVCSAVLNGNIGQGQICSNVLKLSVPLQSVTTVPWTIGGAPVGVTYTPPGMTIAAASTAGTYVASPVFYISDLGKAADNVGHAYAIDAVGYGGTAATVAVVESTVEVKAGVTNLGGL